MPKLFASLRTHWIDDRPDVPQAPAATLAWRDALGQKLSSLVLPCERQLRPLRVGEFEHVHDGVTSSADPGRVHVCAGGGERGGQGVEKATLVGCSSRADGVPWRRPVVEDKRDVLDGGCTERMILCDGERRSEVVGPWLLRGVHEERRQGAAVAPDRGDGADDVDAP